MLEDYLLAFVLFLLAFKIYLKITCGKYTIEHEISNKTAVITGATYGVGLEVAKQLAQYGATVHLLCDNFPEGQRTAARIIFESENDRVFAWNVQLNKLSSVREFAHKYAEYDYPIDILINNDAQWYPAREETEEGLEKTMASNHYGPFLLTHLLLPKLDEGGSGRIVNVTSWAYRWASLDMDNCDLRKGYSGYRAYYNSKLANILFTKELAKHMGNSATTVNCVHPGAIVSHLWQPTMPLQARLLYFLLAPFAKSNQEAAASVLYVACNEDIEDISGQYFADCRLAPVKINERLAKPFWDLSMYLTGVSTDS